MKISSSVIKASKENAQWYHDCFGDPKHESVSRFEDTVQHIRRDVDFYVHELPRYGDSIHVPEDKSSRRVGSEA